MKTTPNKIISKLKGLLKQKSSNGSVEDLSQTQLKSFQQDNSNSSNTKEEIRHIEKIEGTPFAVAGNDVVGYCILLGMIRISEHYETIPEAKEALNKNHWEITMNLISTCIELNKKWTAEEERMKVHADGQLKAN